MVEGGKTPIADSATLRGLGFKIAVFPVAALFAAAEAMERAFEHLLRNGTTEGLGNRYILKDFEELIGAGKHRELEEKYS